MQETLQAGMAVWGDVVRANSRTRPDKVAFTRPDGAAITFGQFNARVNQLNNALTALGVKRGARVAILSRNRPEFVEAYGVAKSGMIAVPLNWRLSSTELLAQLAHSRPEVVIADQDFAVVVDSINSELRGVVNHFIVFDKPGNGWIDYEPMLAQASPAEPAGDVQPDDVLCLMYTSGTTGAPKGVALTHRGLLRNCWAAKQLLGLQPEDTSLVVMPLFHVGAMWYHLFPGFIAGCTTFILGNFEPADLLAQLAQQRITNMHIVPTMIAALLNHPQVCDTDLSHLRLIFYAGSSIPADSLERALAVFKQCEFLQSYGSTEAGMITALVHADHLRAQQQVTSARLLSSCGLPLPETEIRVVDVGSRDVPAEQVGEIVVRSARTMKGYWQDSTATERVIVDGWVHTGDLGRVAQDGYIYVLDRKNDMIVTGGENVYPGEVEAVFYRDPDVLEAAVFGVPDPIWVEKVVAVVVLRPGAEATSDVILRRARGQLAGYKCPKEIIFTDCLPKSGVGKILKKTLRSQYAQILFGVQKSSGT